VKRGLISGTDDRDVRSHLNFPSRNLIILSSFRREVRMNRIEIPRQTVPIHVFPNLNRSTPRLNAIDPNIKLPILYCFDKIFRNMMKYDNKTSFRHFTKNPTRGEFGGDILFLQALQAGIKIMLLQLLIVLRFRQRSILFCIVIYKPECKSLKSIVVHSGLNWQFMNSRSLSTFCCSLE
jgi:hypothetical protein